MVLPWNRGTSFSRYQYRRGHGTTVVPQYHKYRGTTVYGTCQQIVISAKIFVQKQFIDRENKLELFKLY